MLYYQGNTNTVFNINDTPLDVYGNSLQVGDRILLSRFGHLNEYYYLYKTKKTFVFSKFTPEKDDVYNKEYLYNRQRRSQGDFFKRKSEYLSKMRRSCSNHNNIWYCKHLYVNSFLIVEKDCKIPEILKKYLKHE